MKTHFVRADEVRVGHVVWHSDAQHQVLRVRDASDGGLVLTLRPAIGRAIDVKVPPWEHIAVIEP